MKVRISDDSVALACGADMLARAFEAEGVDVERVSSWGMHWMEPLVEVDGIGYPNATADQVADILAGRAEHIGPIEKHPFIVWQTRLIFLHAGKTRPLSLEDYAGGGGWPALRSAQEMGAEDTLQTIIDSGLRGHGGAGHSVGAKWKAVAQAPGDRKYIVCNGNEGDSGTFADRAIMEGDPFLLIEGMAIAAVATGAQKGFVYIRAEYPHAISKMEAAILASAHLIAPFEIEVRVGAGSYVCGEETALLNSIEGKPGEVRAKPPLPTHRGLFDCPTVVNNVQTLAALPWIMVNGPIAYANFGMGSSRGTIPIQLSGNIRHSGIFETAFGMSLGELVKEIGGGTASGRPVRAVQVGGPLGAYHSVKDFDLPFDYESFSEANGQIGHGGIVVFDDTVDMAKQARFAMKFCAEESCGICTSCSVGSTSGMEMLDQVMAGERIEENLRLLGELAGLMREGSLCQLGSHAPYPMISAITRFPEDFAPKGRA